MDNVVRVICTILITTSVIGSAIYNQHKTNQLLTTQLSSLQTIVQRQNTILNELTEQGADISVLKPHGVYKSPPRKVQYQPTTLTQQKQYRVNEQRQKQMLAQIEKNKLRAENRAQNDRECNHWSNEHSISLKTGDKSRIRTAANNMRTSCARARNN